mgnify:CR=1 FL=1
MFREKISNNSEKIKIFQKIFPIFQKKSPIFQKIPNISEKFPIFQKNSQYFRKIPNISEKFPIFQKFFDYKRKLQAKYALMALLIIDIFVRLNVFFSNCQTSDWLINGQSYPVVSLHLQQGF